MEGTKTQFRVQTSDCKLGRPVPLLIGHGFLRLFFFCTGKHFNSIFLFSLPKMKLNLCSPSVTLN